MFCYLRSSFDPFSKGLKYFSRVRIQAGVGENPFLPGGIAQISQNVFEGHRGLARIPKTFDYGLRRGEMPGLRVPQQYEVIDVEDQGSGSLGGLGDSILGVFKTEELLDVAEADLQGPAQSEDLKYLWRCESKIRGEEAIVAAATAGIADHHDTQQSRAGAGVPQRVDGLIPNLDVSSIETHGGFDPGALGILRHLQRIG